MKEKLENLGSLNDGDLGAISIPGLTETDPSEKIDEVEYNREKLATLLEKRSRLLRELAEVDQQLRTEFGNNQ